MLKKSPKLSLGISMRGIQGNGSCTLFLIDMILLALKRVLEKQILEKLYPQSISKPLTRCLLCHVCKWSVNNKLNWENYNWRTSTKVNSWFSLSLKWKWINNLVTYSLDLTRLNHNFDKTISLKPGNIYGR